MRGEERVRKEREWEEERICEGRGGGRELGGKREGEGSKGNYKG